MRLIVLWFNLCIIITIKIMEKKLTLYDPEENTSYTLTLNESDYCRALIDEEYASSLLSSARQEFQEETNTTEAPCSPRQDRTSWTRNEILLLLSLFKENEFMYKSTTTRKEQFWNDIANKLESNKTAEQCRNKFKYLKSMYLKKKDNMSNRQTGTPKLNFTYFEEMDSIFKKEPIVKPLAIASSSESINDSDVDSHTHSEKENQPPKKKMKADEANELLNFLKEKEIKTERRHRENMEKKDEALNICKQLLSVAEKIANK